MGHGVRRQAFLSGTGRVRTRMLASALAAFLVAAPVAAGATTKIFIANLNGGQEAPRGCPGGC